MKTVKPGEICFQGDCMMEAVDCMPKSALRAKDGVLTHSESGHAHVAERAQVFECDDGMTLYMRAIGKSIDIVHQRPTDTHETLRLEGQPGQLWRVRRQREWSPAGWKRVED